MHTDHNTCWLSNFVYVYFVILSFSLLSVGASFAAPGRRATSNVKSKILLKRRNLILALVVSTPTHSPTHSFILFSQRHELERFIAWQNPNGAAELSVPGERPHPLSLPFQLFISPCAFFYSLRWRRRGHMAEPHPVWSSLAVYSHDGLSIISSSCLPTSQQVSSYSSTSRLWHLVSEALSNISFDVYLFKLLWLLFVYVRLIHFFVSL